MSHFTRVKTKINHLPSFLCALNKLGLKYEVGVEGRAARVRGWIHQEIHAEVAVKMGKYDLGLVPGEDGLYEIAADWWGIETTTGRTEREVVDEIAREYSLARVQAALAEAGYEVEGEPVYTAEGEVEVLACQWN